MSNFRGWAARVASLFHRRALDERLEEELGLHVELASRELQAQGMSAEEARRTARLRLAPGGALERIRESHRAGRGVPALEMLAQDLRYAVRTMRKSPGFTAVALLSLAFGIGTNSAIFSVVDALLLKGLPVPDADRLAVLNKSLAGDRAPLFSYSSFRRLQDSGAACTGVIAVTDDFTTVVRPLIGGRPDRTAAATPAAASIAASAPIAPLQTPPSAALEGAGNDETADAQLVSGNLFAVLGVGAAVGRTFTAAEDAVPGGNPVVVLSYGYWEKRFGRDPAVVGESLLVNGMPVAVLGVLPRGFRGVLADEAPDLFLPVTLRDVVRYRGNMSVDGPDDPKQPVWHQVNEHWLELLAKRRSGVSLEKARAVLGVLFEREKQAEMVGRTDPDDRRQLQAEKLLVEPGSRGLAYRRESLTRPLLVLMGLAGLVLLIACTNVATLLMARADRRRKEMAVRLGIGAGRARVLRQLVTESLLLAGLGGALGLVFAAWGSRLLLRLVSQGADPVPLDVDLDWRKVAFALGVALVTGLAFGIVPALQATRVDLAAVLKQGARAMKGAGRGGHRLPLGRVLVAAQVGLSLVLLIGAGLFVRSLQNLMRVDPGFTTGGLVAARINPSVLAVDDSRLAGVYERLVERLEAIPGVRSASMSGSRLLTGSASTSNVSLPGYVPRANENMDVQHNSVTPQYFATVGLALVAGRPLALTDRIGGRPVAVVNQAMVRRFLPPGSPIGRRFGFGGAERARDIEIVGVVKDAKYHRLDEKAVPLAYLPVAQLPDSMHDAHLLRDIELRVDPAAGDAAVAWVATQLRRAVAEAAPGLPVLSITTMSEQLTRSLARERAVARLTGFFGLLALLLAAIGLYGVMSYSVARRTGEIGLRMALGAPRAEVLGLVIRETLVLVAIGVATGLLATWALARLATSQLFGITSHDPATLVGATAALILVALLAGFLPARRAAGVEPMEALRYE
jgi:predicted permease